jgi:hypothetical protein
MKNIKNPVSVIYNRTDQFITQIFAQPSPQSYQLQEIPASTKKRKKKGKKKRIKTKKSLPSTQSADSPGSLPQPFTFSNHGGHFNKHETRVVIASIFDLFHKKNSHDCLLPFFLPEGNPDPSLQT